jgi:hypothetical protein
MDWNSGRVGDKKEIFILRLTWDAVVPFWVLPLK